MSISSSAPWLKYYGDTPQHLKYPQKTIYEMVKSAADKYPKNYAYEFMGKKTTYAEFMQKIDAAAKAYMALGIQKGDRVTICMPNCPQAVDSFYALNRIGAVSNMIHPLSAAGEIKFYLNFSKSKAILTLDQFYGKIAPIMPELDDPDTKLIIAKIEDELFPHLALGYALTAGRKYPHPERKGNYIWWKEFLRKGKKLNAYLPKNAQKPEDGASILYSGGTTGTTKGILLSNMNFNALGLQTIAASGFAPINGLKMLSVMPVFHGFGLGIGIHTALIGGACCILVPKFNVATYADLLIKKQPNIIPGVPTLFEALLRADKLENADLSCLKGVFCGGDSLSIELKKKVDEFLKAHNASVQIRQGYGLTECVTASCLTPKDYNRVGSIGVPFPDTYYKIVKPGTTDEIDPNVERGIIIGQSPDAGKSYMLTSDGIHVTLTVSTGVMLTEIPNLLNYDYREATSELEKLGFVVDKTFADSDDVAADCVMQISPSPGEKLPAGSTVYLTISQGAKTETVIMPYLVGKDYATAEAELAAARLTLVSVSYVYNNTIPVDYVVSQTVEAGTEIPAYSKIYLQISLGPETTPTPSPSPVPTQDPNAE